MHQHRFREQQQFSPRPAIATPVLSATAFVVCPLMLPQGGMGQQSPWPQLYQLAFEQAQAVLRPSRLERLQAVSLN
jgi:hypothetical protein